jgi:TonB family protein
MHRKLHPLWAFGQLAAWDKLPSSSLFNNPELMTGIDLVLTRDGVPESVTIFRSSGFLDYDVAVVDTVLAASPFPAPPAEVLSTDGKVHVEWQIHRDGRQCSTGGLDAFILGSVPSVPDEMALSRLSADERLKWERLSQQILSARLRQSQ